MATAKALLESLEQKRGELAAIFDKYKTADGQFDMPAEVAAEVKSRNDELTQLGKEWDAARSLEEIATQNAQELAGYNRPAEQPPHPGAQESEKKADCRSLGQRLVESAEFKSRPRGSAWSLHLPDVDLKTTVTRTAGYAPDAARTGDVVPYANRRPVIADYIPQTTTDQSAIKFMRQDTFTRTAIAPKAEGEAAGEAALHWTEVSVPVEKIPAYIPVTEEQLEDVPQIQDLIDQDLTLMLRLTEEEQILTGNGTSPNLQGFLSLSGIQTQAKGSDPACDAVRKAMTLVRVTGRATPSLAVFHPNDWQDIRLMTTTDGVYIWGPPSEAGPERIWGLPILETDAMTENTALVGDFTLYSRIYRRRGITLERTNAHGTNFLAGIWVVKATERLALVVRREAAFATVTGL